METKKKYIKIITVVSIAIILIVGSYYIYVNTIAKKDTENEVKELYTCPMHPQIIQDRPGQCPICGMDLVKKNIEKNDTSASGNNSEDMNSIKLSPSQQVLANVQTERVRVMQFQGEKTFNGYVKINETKFAHISTSVSGKIVKMFVNYEGQPVRKGQPVLEIYSPELVATKKEYLLALNNLNQVNKSENSFAIEQAESLVRSARERLSQWEMTSAQIEELERTEDPTINTIQYSKYSGIVTKKYVHVGHWATAGEDIYDVADLSTVWVIANVYESDMQYIKNGQIAEILSSAYPDEIMVARINFINPVFNPDSRTMEVRIDVTNSNLRLKPDMYVKVRINTYITQTIGVPKNAVIRTGEHNLVYIEKEKGIYEPRQVQISYEQDGYYAITSGLKEDEIIVTSGGFLIDSETQIQKGFTSGHENHGTNKNNDELKINPDQDIMKDIQNKNQDLEHKH